MGGRDWVSGEQRVSAQERVIVLLEVFARCASSLEKPPAVGRASQSSGGEGD
jgi:hypothetical protein